MIMALNLDNRTGRRNRNTCAIYMAYRDSGMDFIAGIAHPESGVTAPQVNVSTSARL